MNRDFKGIWIPREIWLLKGLKPTYRVFLAEIDSLDKGDGCWANNQHFATMFGLSKNRCSEIIVMLSEKGHISVSYESDDDGMEIRKLHLRIAVEKSTGLSKNRQELSRNRQKLSKNRLAYIRNKKYNKKYNEIYISAFEYLKKEFPSELEQVLMGFKSQIRDWAEFVSFYNNSCDEKELPYTRRALFGRLQNLKDTWIKNQEKNRKLEKESTTNLPPVFR